MDNERIIRALELYIEEVEKLLDSFIELTVISNTDITSNGTGSIENEIAGKLLELISEIQDNIMSLKKNTNIRSSNKKKEKFHYEEIKEHINLTSNVPFDKLPGWFQEAKTEDAIVNYSDEIFIWKSGTWENGLWKNGTWKNGTWEDGLWKNGIWENGIWENGVWENGEWESGEWVNGIWEGGVWVYGTWQSGEWKNGTWVGGVWNSEELKPTE